MDNGILTTFGNYLTNTIIGVGSLFFSYIDGVDVQFESINLNPQHSQVAISTQLSNWSSKEFDEILSSGEEIKIEYFVEVVDIYNDNIVSRKEFYHSVKYHILDNYFEVYFSEDNRSFNISNLEILRQKFTKITNVDVIQSNRIIENHQYKIEITAMLPVLLFPNTQKSFDMMLFWKRKIPNQTSRIFDKSIFVI